MKRDLKFRGMSVHSGEGWFVGSYVVSKYGHYICEEETQLGSFLMSRVRPETVGLSTGLRDKYKKEIYEGDVLHKTENDEVFRVDELVPAHRHTHVTNIGYFDGEGVYERRDNPAAQDDNMDDWMSWPEMYIVIGNIWDNKDQYGVEPKEE